MHRYVSALTFALLLVLCPARAQAEDGYRLWLRYDPVEQPARDRYRLSACQLVSDPGTPVEQAASDELHRGLSGLLGQALPRAAAPTCDGAIILARRSSPLLQGAGIGTRQLGSEGYVLRTARVNGRRALVISADGDRGLLYGAFALLRRVQLRQPIDGIALSDAPALDLRMLNHWDNLDRHVERGYAGQSLWDWQKLPLWRDPRVADYGRANASVGINATVLNNVNSNAEILTAPWLGKVRALADQLRPWGMRVFLSARFSAPKEIGGLPTADPLDPAVAEWWRRKADEIYAAVPDFGGFLVKANSEGQPGPQDYGRTHADGANMLAAAVRPHGGTILWRAFVYAPDADDRTKQGYAEFKPLDGRFASNVVVQVKNGPLDFQPREPFHPLFGAMPRSRLALEVQLTKEYLGFATHLAYLGPMWEEVLRSRTYRPQRQSRVSDTISAMAGVANIGTDRNWTGSHFDQANWYAYGRLAWNPAGEAPAIGEEWTRQTWGNDPRVVSSVTGMMNRSREAVVDYMTPLGLAHLMGSDHHYGPAPWVADLPRPDWNPVYYHRADRNGIGFDRTERGSGAIGQYARALQQRLARPASTPVNALLWFHHLPWGYRMPSGRTLWEDLIASYDRGVASVGEFRSAWDGLSGAVDGERHAQVSAFLRIQQQEAQWWRDASVAYWQEVSQRPLPPGAPPPRHPLAYYKALRFPFAPGQAR